MTFLNLWLLLALPVVLIPVVLHLLKRQQPRTIDWGAMQFLIGALVRRRRTLLEEILLLLVRCLIVTLVILALARPFLPAGAGLAAALALPAVLLAVAAVAAASALADHPRWRRSLYFAGAVLSALFVGLLFWQPALLRRENSGQPRDLAIVIDGSMSMALRSGKQTLFAEAVAEAQSLVKTLGTAGSVSIVLSGAEPVLVTPTPLRDPKAVGQLLAGLKPIGSSAALRDATMAASTQLKGSSNAVRQIVIFTDGQRLGWQTDKAAAWEELAAELESYPVRPQLLVRVLSPPKSVFNVALEELTLSRELVGTDRPLGLRARLVNAGTTPVAGGNLILSVDEQVVERRPFAKLEPGQREVITFYHQLDRIGGHHVEARVDLDDDLPADNTRELSVPASGPIQVLIVSDRQQGPFLERASACLELALSPDRNPTSPDRNPTSPDNSPTQDGGAAVPAAVPAAPILFQVKVVSPETVPQLAELSRASLVVLADLPRLSSAAAERVARYVVAGGSLFVTPGRAALPEFYDGWSDAQGSPVLPARLERLQIPPPGQAPVGLALASLRHSALERLESLQDMDLKTAGFSAYWRLAVTATKDVAVGGRLTDGSPYLVEKPLGLGRVLLSAAPLDLSSGDLVTRQSFPTLVHALVGYLSGAANTRLTYSGGSELLLTVYPSPGESLAFGRFLPGLLREQVVASASGTTTVRETDAQIDLNAASEQSGVRSTRWTGSLVPEHTENYRLTISGRGRPTFWLDGKQIIESRPPSGRLDRRDPARIRWSQGNFNHYVTAPLVAGRHHELRLDLQTVGENAAVRFSWSSPSQSEQPVPAGALFHFGSADTGEGEQDQFTVIRPDGSTARCATALDDRAVRVTVASALGPGLYKVRPPASLSARLVHVQDKEGAIPVVVEIDSRELDGAPLPPEERATVESLVRGQFVPSFEQLDALAAGRGIGREIWTYLVLMVVILLVAESLTTRWIALSRHPSVQPAEVINEPQGRRGGFLTPQVVSSAGESAVNRADQISRFKTGAIR